MDVKIASVYPAPCPGFPDCVAKKCDVSPSAAPSHVTKQGTGNLRTYTYTGDNAYTFYIQLALAVFHFA